MPHEPVRVGIGLRRAHYAVFTDPGSPVFGADPPIDFVEITPENFAGIGGRAARVIDTMRGSIEVMVHGVSLSLGGPDELRCERVRALGAFARSLGAERYSDHVCTSAAGGVESFDLLPVPFHDDAVRHIAARARVASELLELPLALENITYYAKAPGSALDEGAFLRAVLEESDAGLLLDVSNVVVNAKNHRVPAHELLDALPLDRTVAIHLAGHRHDKRLGLVIDDHASAISSASLSLYERALAAIGRPVPTLVEWDQRVPPIETLFAEVARVRAAALRATRAEASGASSRGAAGSRPIETGSTGSVEPALRDGP